MVSKIILSPFIACHELTHLVFLCIFNLKKHFKFTCNRNLCGFIPTAIESSESRLSITQCYGLILACISPILLILPTVLLWSKFNYFLPTKNSMFDILLYFYLNSGLICMMIPSKADINSARSVYNQIINR